MVAAEAARAEVRSAVKRAAGAAGREAVEAATADAGRALARRGVAEGAEAATGSVRLARWWAVRAAGGTYQVLRRLPEALPRLTVPEIADLGRGLCAKAGLGPHHLGAAPVPQGGRGDRPPDPPLAGPEVPGRPGHPGRRRASSGSARWRSTWPAAGPRPRATPDPTRNPTEGRVGRRARQSRGADRRLSRRDGPTDRHRPGPDPEGRAPDRPGPSPKPEDRCDASAIESPPPVVPGDRPGCGPGRRPGAPWPALAGKVSWLDDVVQEVVVEARAGGRAVAAGTAAARAAGRLFAREADEGLEALARRSDDLARAGRRAETPAEALLQARFTRLVRPEPETARAFAALAPAEKRVVVEMGEAAQQLARRYPGQAEAMVRELGTEGLAAVRVYGDDVAEVVVKEGPEALGVLRKTGRGGWAFFTNQVLPNKKKLAAAGVLAAFLADPDQFVDSAGRATEYAVRQFAQAGVQLAGAVCAGAARGLEASIGEALAAYGLNFAALRYLGMGLAGLVVFASALVLLGLPGPLDAPAVHLALPADLRPREAGQPL